MVTALLLHTEDHIARLSDEMAYFEMKIVNSR